MQYNVIIEITYEEYVGKVDMSKTLKHEKLIKSVIDNFFNRFT